MSSMARVAQALSPERIQQLVAAQDVASLESNLLSLAAANANCKPVVVALIDIDTTQAWDAVGRFLAKQQHAVVAFTIADLEEVSSAGATRALGAALSNSNAAIRKAAVRSLARQEPGASIPHLLRASRDPNAEIAAMARATIVQRMNEAPNKLADIPERVLDGVFDLLDARKPFVMVNEGYPDNVRIVAAQRLGRVADAEAAEIFASMLLTAEGRLADACWNGLERCRDLSDMLLLPLLSHSEPKATARALRIFAKTAQPEDAGTFAAMARDPTLEVRKAAVAGLAKVAGSAYIDTLALSLHDAQEVRHLVIDLLGEIPESQPHLLRVVDHRDPEVRKRTLTHLASRGVINDELMPRYYEFLIGGKDCTDQSDTKYIDSLAAVAKTLGKSNKLEGLKPLANLARSTMRRLRRTAIEAIMHYSPASRADVLFGLLDSYDQDVLKNVAEGLWETRDKRALIPLIRVSRESRGAPVKRAKQALQEFEELKDCEFLLKLLKRPFASVRRFTAEQLTRMRDPRSVPGLLAASRDEDVDVQLAVFEALAPFAGEHVKVRDRMLETLSYGDVSVRQAACEALGEARCKEAVPHLTKALHNCFLRPRATEALKRIGDRMGMLSIKRLERRERMFKKKAAPHAQKTSRTPVGRSVKARSV